jgi:hypothetical protein
VRGPVDPDRAGQDEPVHADAARGLQRAAGALDVEPQGPDRVGGDLLDVGGGGQVEHHLAAVQGAGQVVQVEDVGLAVLGGRVELADRGVHHHDLVPGGEESVDDVRADEAAAPGDDGAHGESPSCPDLSRTSRATPW